MTPSRTRADNDWVKPTPTHRHRTSTGAGSRTRRAFRASAETNSGGTQLAAWLYCHDKAGNLTATSSTTTACNSAGTTYTYNAANQTTNTGWTFDANGNETTAGGGLPRTGETYGDFNQLTAITRGSTTSTATYTGTTNAERLNFGATDFHYGSEGLTATVTNGVETGFVREPSGSLTAMSTGEAHHYYLTDAQGSVIAMTDKNGNKVNTYAYDRTATPAPPPKQSPTRSATRAPTSIRPACTRWAPATTTPPSAASPNATPQARKPTPTHTHPATRSTGRILWEHSASADSPAWRGRRRTRGTSVRSAKT